MNLDQVSFHSLAERELNEAAAYYELQAAGLGSDFVSAVETCALRLVQFPASGLLIATTTRRAFVRGFPYALLYKPKPTGIRVLAVMHTRRRPGYWAGRR